MLGRQAVREAAMHLAPGLIMEVRTDPFQCRRATAARCGAPGRFAASTRPRWSACRFRWPWQAGHSSALRQHVCRTGAAQGGPGTRWSGADGSARRPQSRRPCWARRRSARQRSSAWPRVGARQHAVHGRGVAGSRASARNRGGCDRHGSVGWRRGQYQKGCSGAPALAARWAGRTVR